MAYDLKNVFYLDTEATVTKDTAGLGSAQLDLSAYINPIARKRQRGTGLAIYKAHFSVTNSEDVNEIAPKVTDEGVMAVSLAAGLGIGNLATGDGQQAASVGTTTNFDASSQLLIAGGMFYAPGSAATSTPVMDMYCEPSEKVPYVIVRDNVCLVYCVSSEKKFTSTSTLAVRLECAQITLDQATLNQLLRTQTV